MTACTDYMYNSLRICNAQDHEIAAHYKDMVTRVVLSFEDELPRTLYILSLVMKKYLKKGYREDMYYDITDLYPEDSNISLKEFDRVMRHSVPLGMFETKKNGNMAIYCLC